MADETPPPSDGEAQPAGKGPKGVILIAALVGGLLAGVAGGLFALGPMLARKSGYVATPHAGADSTAAEAEEGEHASGEGKEGEAVSTVYTIDNIILNPAGSGGTRFLMLAAAIDAKDAGVIEQMKARDAETRDVLLRVMGSKTVEELADMQRREAIKKELSDSLGALFKKGAIRRVYFPQYVIQ